MSMRSRGLALRRDYMKTGFDNGNNEEVCLHSDFSVFHCSYSIIFTFLTSMHVFRVIDLQNVSIGTLCHINTAMLWCCVQCTVGLEWIMCELLLL